MKSLASLDEITPPLYPPLGHLDYPGVELVMEACTDFDRNTGKQNPPEKAYRLNACRKEPWTVAFIESMPEEGGVLYDIGANVGSYTLVAAARNQTVIAIDAAAPNVAALKRNVLRNGFAAGVISLHLALADKDGIVWINYGDQRSGSASHSLGDPRNPYFTREIILVARLDTLITTYGLMAPTHIKIDVDGGEWGVVLGMEQTLAAPELQGLLIEMRLDLEEQIVGFLKEHGWQMAERFDEREGQKIGNICYSRFVRAPVVTVETAVSTSVTGSASTTSVGIISPDGTVTVLDGLPEHEAVAPEVANGHAEA